VTTTDTIAVGVEIGVSSLLALAVDDCGRVVRRAQRKIPDEGVTSTHTGVLTIRHACARRLSPAQAEKIRVELSVLGGDAVALGAARLAMTAGR
jgi:hypothetical protein